MGTLAEGVGFEPTLGLPLSLISSQVPSTTQPPFRTLIINDLRLIIPAQFFLCIPALYPVKSFHEIGYRACRSEARGTFVE